MYSVFTIYYKYGEFNVDILDDDSLREYCMEQLDEYNGDGNVDYHGLDDIEVLIDKTIEYGKKFVEEQGLGE